MSCKRGLRIFRSLSLGDDSLAFVELLCLSFYLKLKLELIVCSSQQQIVILTKNFSSTSWNEKITKVFHAEHVPPYQFWIFLKTSACYRDHWAASRCVMWRKVNCCRVFLTSLWTSSSSTRLLFKDIFSDSCDALIKARVALKSGYVVTALHLGSVRRRDPRICS